MAVSYFEKNKRQPDLNTLVKIAEMGNVYIDWLLTDIGEKERPTEKPLLAAEEPAKYYNLAEESVKKDYDLKEDIDLTNIIVWLKENPHDRALILKLIKGKKDIKEALEGFDVKNTLNEEG